MSLRDDGGPAFPIIRQEEELHEDRYRTVIFTHGGMTLRDYFAAKALQAIIAKNYDADLKRPTDRAHLHAYEYADAMLAERKKKETR